MYTKLLLLMTIKYSLDLNQGHDETKYVILKFPIISFVGVTCRYLICGRYLYLTKVCFLFVVEVPKADIEKDCVEKYSCICVHHTIKYVWLLYQPMLIYMYMYVGTVWIIKCGNLIWVYRCLVIPLLLLINKNLNQKAH